MRRELSGTPTHLSTMWSRLPLALGVLALLGGCGMASSSPDAGIEGRVMLGPQCPVVQTEDPCPEKPAPSATVTVSEPGPDAITPGNTVTTGTTDSTGSFHIAVDPGEYVITADAGMSCKPTAITVTDTGYISADITCDTGIR